MNSPKAWLAGLLAAGLVTGIAGSALGHSPQEESGMHYGYGMGQGMMMTPGMDHESAMRPGPGMYEGRGMHEGYGMHRQHGAHHAMHPQMHSQMHPQMRPGMHSGTHAGQGMMMGPGTGMGPGAIYGWPTGEGQELAVEDVRGWLERILSRHGNPRLKLGEVQEADDGTLVAEIVTKDGSLVQKLAIDRHSGALRQLDD